jgi:hypothetical protein
VWLIVSIAVAVIILCCICLATTSVPSLSSLTNIQAKYVITGSANSAFVTYTNEQGGTEQVNVDLPFEKNLVVKPGTTLVLVAQNQGTGTITCEIWIHGEKMKTSTSSAQYGSVTCSDFAR